MTDHYLAGACNIGPAEIAMRGPAPGAADRGLGRHRGRVALTAMAVP
jgi:hypothetical protein